MPTHRKYLDKIVRPETGSMPGSLARRLALEAYETGRTAAPMKAETKKYLREQVAVALRSYFDDGAAGEPFTMKTTYA